MKRCLFIIFYGLFISCNSLHAQELDLSSYIALVEKNNIDLKLSSNAKKVSGAETKIAKSLLLPSLSLEGNYQRDFTKNFLFINDFDGTTTAFRTNFNNTVDLNAIAGQTLFDASAFATVKIAKLAEELSELNHENLSKELVVQASSLYWKTLFVKESIEVLEANTALAKEQMDQIETFYEKGVVSELQLQQAKALYKKTLPVLNNAKNQYQNLLNELKNLANIPTGELIRLTDKLENIEFKTTNSDSVRNIEGQPQIRAIKKELEIAEKQLAGKKNFWLPKLNLALAYNYNGQDDAFNLSNNTNKLFFGQLNLSIPLFSGGGNRAEISKAMVEKESAELNLKNKRQEFLKQLQIADNNYSNAQNNISLYKETIRVNEREIEIFKKQVSFGVVTPLEFKESRLRLTQSKLELLNGYLDLQLSKLQIKRILGEEL